MVKIKQTTFRIAHIVKGLLTFARNDKNQEFQPVEISSTINDVSSFCSEKAKSAKINIRFLSDENLWINGLSVQISKVLLNLINNSIDAISEIETTDRWIDVEARLLEDHQTVRFSVTDLSKGLSNESIDKLMQPFFTTKPVGKGTGLGLSISKGLVESHGGTLRYDRASANTRFYFDLKRLEAPRKKIQGIA